MLNGSKKTHITKRVTLMVELKVTMEIAQAYEVASVQTKAMGRDVVARIATRN